MQRATLDEGVSILQEMRAAGSPNSLLFAGVDHAALVAWMEENRAWLVSESVKESGETEEVATRDLDGLVALLRLFRARSARAESVVKAKCRSASVGPSAVIGAAPSLTRCADTE
jgi:hypothetical protein